MNGVCDNSAAKRAKRAKLLLLAGAALAFLPASGAYAQSGGTGDSPTAGQSGADNSADAIVVTGSRIRGVAPVGSNLIEVGADEITKSGASTVSEVLRQIPQITSLSINAEGATGAGAGSNITRATGPNLRGLGSTATLVVFDGERVPIAGTQGNFVDPSFIPSMAIERLEVVADGASAIYGSDAVAGVINLIPRKKFTGVEMRARAGFADSYSEYQVGAVAGANWNSGNLVVAAEYVRNDALLGTDRDFVSSDHRAGGGSDARSTSCSPATIAANGLTYAVPSDATGVIDFTQLTPGTANRCDLSKPGFLIPKQERISLYGYFHQELNDTFSLFAQGFFSRREFSGPISGQYSVTNLVVPTSNPWYPSNAPASPIAVSTNFLDTAGLSNTHGTSRTYLAIAGVKADFGGWNAKFAGSYGESSDEEDRDLNIDTAALTAALANPDPTKAINPFGTTPNDPNLVASVYLDKFNPSVTNRMKTLEAEANGPLFRLPGGEVRMALGAEYREESQFGAFTFGPKTSPISLPNNISRNVKAVFAEFYVPLVGPDNATPGVSKLDLLAAVRHESYSDFGSTTNPKIGLTWSPIEGVSVRGSYGTSFRAPGLAEIDPNSSGAGIYQMPVSVGGALPLNLALVAAGNPNLKPETAKTWSAGVDLTPTTVPGLRLSATYFNINYKGQVVDVFTIVPQVLAEPQNFSNIAFLRNGPNWQQGIDFLKSVPYYIPGTINFSLLDGIIDARKANLGKTIANGMDFDVTYQFHAGSSDFSIGANGTVFFQYKNSTGAGELVSRLGTYGFPQKFRARTWLGWSNGPVSAQATLNYLSSYKNLTSILVQNVSSYTTVDLDLGYTFGEGAGSIARGARIGLNARNLFNRKPPFVDAGLGYDPSAASALGRIVSISLSKSF